MFIQLQAPPLAPDLRQMPLPRGFAQVWPQHQPLHNLLDDRIFGTVFQDVNLYHPEMIQRACNQAAVQPQHDRWVGGKKVRDHETWTYPAFN